MSVADDSCDLIFQIILVVQEKGGLSINLPARCAAIFSMEVVQRAMTLHSEVKGSQHVGKGRMEMDNPDQRYSVAICLNFQNRSRDE